MDQEFDLRFSLCVHNQKIDVTGFLDAFLSSFLLYLDRFHVVLKSLSRIRALQPTVLGIVYTSTLIFYTFKTCRVVVTTAATSGGPVTERFLWFKSYSIPVSCVVVVLGQDTLPTLPCTNVTEYFVVEGQIGSHASVCQSAPGQLWLRM